MNPVQTGIAVACALGLVALIFIIPAFAPYLHSAVTPADVASTTAALTETQTTMPQAADVKDLQITDIAVGAGATAKAGDQVTVNYVGSLTNGTVFDASANHGQPFSFILGAGQVIKGWDQGLLGMREGGKRVLAIPASLAYGAQGITDPTTGQVIIPGNATLIFQVELVKVTAAK